MVILGGSSVKGDLFFFAFSKRLKMNSLSVVESADSVDFLAVVELSDFDERIRKVKNLNFTLIFNKRVSEYSALNNLDIKFAKREYTREVVRKMGWKTSANLTSYLSGQKELGSQVISRLSSVLFCNPSDIDPLLADSDLQREREGLVLKNEKLTRYKNNIKVKNINRLWLDFKKDYPSITQESFSRDYLNQNAQSNFSVMLSGKKIISSVQVRKLSQAFGCMPSEIDPYWDQVSDNIDYNHVKNINKEILSYIDLDNLSKDQLKTIDVFKRLHAC